MATFCLSLRKLTSGDDISRVNKLMHQNGVSAYKHIEAETKCPPFSRRHFQMRFLEWKFMKFVIYVTEVCS